MHTHIYRGNVTKWKTYGTFLQVGMSQSHLCQESSLVKFEKVVINVSSNSSDQSCDLINANVIREEKK